MFGRCSACLVRVKVRLRVRLRVRVRLRASGWVAARLATGHLDMEAGLEGRVCEVR